MSTAPAISTDSNFSFATRSDTALSVMLLLTLVTLIIPLPTFLLDMLLALNLGGAILLLLVTMNARKPLELSVFPALLLLMTLFRLSLNVATTRLILLNGDAGKIVTTFGDFVVGGNLIVGIVIFAILITIQFIVITKGATRISEVNARFTLDSMPGKQMAIDAELNMGAIDEKEASRRRQTLAREAEFFGAMDGASKYVRGDAIAGLVILAVNILGGVTLGMMQGQALGDAVEMYTILTIGDGLVSQIPALVISMAAGILVTKSGSDQSLGEEIRSQFTASWRSLMLAAGVLAAVSLTPGLPKLPFWLMALALAVVAQRIRQQQARPALPAETLPAAQAGDDKPPEERNLARFLQCDRIRLEVGAMLQSLVEPRQGRDLAARISALRDEMATQYGFWIPRVRIFGNNHLPDVQQFRLHVNGRQISEGVIQTSHLLAVHPEGRSFEFPGEKTTDPAFGLPACWIDPASRQRAEAMGLMVTEPAHVLITHLGEHLRRHAHELLSREDLQRMLVRLKESAPTIVEEIRPEILRPAVLHQVLRNLLAEQVPITSLESIVEAALQFGAAIKDPEELTERVRAAIGPIVTDRFRGGDGRIRIVVCEPALDQQLRQQMQPGLIPLKASQLQRLVTRLRHELDQAALRGQPAALAVDSAVRRALRQTLIRSLPDLPLISFAEIPGGTYPEIVATVRLGDVYENIRAGGEDLSAGRVPGTSMTAEAA